MGIIRKRRPEAVLLVPGVVDGRRSTFRIEVLYLGMDYYLLHKFFVDCLVVSIDCIAKLRRPDTTFKTVKRHSIIDLKTSRVLVAESSCVFPQRFVFSLPNSVKIIGKIETISLYHKVIKESLL